MLCAVGPPGSRSASRGRDACRGALPVEVAIQLAASAEPGDEVAITTLLAAAEALATTDPGASADLSRRALELAPETASPARSARRTGRDVAARGGTDRRGARLSPTTRIREVLPVAQEAEVRLGIAGMWLVSPDVRVHASREALKLPGLPEHLRLAHMAKLAYNLLAAGGRTDEAADRAFGGRQPPAGASTRPPGFRSR